jgi:cytochrome P450
LAARQSAASEHGDVAALAVGPPGRRRRLYLVSHPDGVHRILAGEPVDYVKGTPIQREITTVFGGGLLTSVGPDWRQQRRALAPLFTPRNLDEYVPVLPRRRFGWSSGGPPGRRAGSTCTTN